LAVLVVYQFFLLKFNFFKIPYNPLMQQGFEVYLTIYEKYVIKNEK
jgi:hypothetical protein